MAVAAERGVVAGLGDIFEAGGNGGLVGERGENDAGVRAGAGWRITPVLRPEWSPCPAITRDSLTVRWRRPTHAGCRGTRDSVGDGFAERFGTATAARLAGKHSFDRGEQAGHREGLLDEVGGAEAGGGDRVLDVGVAGNHDDAGVRLLGLDAAEQFDAVKLGHPDVQAGPVRGARGRSKPSRSGRRRYRARESPRLSGFRAKKT